MLCRKIFISSFIFLIGLICLVDLKAQVPIINSISKQYGTVFEEIVISGNNFPVNTSDVIVIFGSTAANVLTTAPNTIEVEVPAGTTTDNVVVINTANGLSGSSKSQFYLSYSGDDFDPTQLNAEVTYGSAVELYDLCLCDFNDDGKSDVAVTKINTETDILVFENNSVVETINLTERNRNTNPELDLSSPTSNITCGDLNGDGLPDLVVSKTGNPRDVIYVLENTSSAGNIQFASAISLFLSVEEIAKILEIKDLDIDGKPEIIVSNTFSGNVKIFQNTSSGGTLQFNPSPLSVNFAGAVTTNGLVVEDLNGDQLPDLATCPFFESNIYVRLNNSTLGNFIFGSVQVINIPGNLNVMASGDFDTDGLIDLAVSKTVQNEVIVLENQTPTGNSVVSFNQQTLNTEGNPWGLNATDIDGDGLLDLLVAIRDINTINIFENTGGGNTIDFSRHSISTLLMSSRNIVGGDIDGDAKPDIVFTSFDSTPQYFMSVIRNGNCFKPVIDPPGPLSLCSGGTIDLSASKGVGITYTWDKDNVVFKTGSEDTIIVTQPGVFKTIATSQSGLCTSISNAVIVNAGSGSVPTNPVIYNDGPFCLGENILLSTDAVAGGTYLWTGPNGYTSTSQSVVIPDATAARAGQYSLQVTVGDCSSETSTTIVDLISLPSFSISLTGSSTVCIGDSALMTVNAVAGYTYQWYREGSEITGETGSSIYAKSSGTYIAEVTQTSSGCVTFSTNTITLTFIEAPVASFEYNDPECAGSDIQFINTSTFEQGESVTYTWDFGDGSSTVNTENPVYAYPGSGSFTIDFTVGYTSGACGNTVSVPVEVNPQPDFTIIQTPDETLCEGEPVELSTSVVYDGYLWNTGATTQAITVRSPFEYYVTVTDANSCSATEFLTLDMLPRPVVVATATPPEVEEDAEVQLDASGAISYRWAPVANLDDPNIPNPTATVTETTLFVVQGLNADGCTDTTSVLVTVIETNTINVTPRNLFSPNGDGIDDFWVIEDIERYPGAEVTIYNAQGSIVYESNNYTNEWNAVYNGKELPETAYFFVIRYNGKDPKTGSVTIIR
jgi:gliding motility-associated-like protein